MFLLPSVSVKVRKEDALDKLTTRHIVCVIFLAMLNNYLI